MLIGMMETEVPESATHVSFVFVDFPYSLPFMFCIALFFFSLDILSFSGLFVSGSNVGFVSGDVAPGYVFSLFFWESSWWIFSSSSLSEEYPERTFLCSCS